MSLEEAAARARHDLGKYICFSARWLDGQTTIAELRAALSDDLLRTRRGPTGETSAAALWAELRVPLASEAGEVDQLMAALALNVANLDGLDRAGLEETARLAREVADALKRLHTRLR